MFPYIVVVASRQRTHEWLLRDRAISPRDWIAHFPEAADRAPEFIDPARPAGMQVHYCRDEEYAMLHAQFLAKLHPDQEVYVTKVTAISVARPAAPTMSKVTEKGVVPL